MSTSFATAPDKIKKSDCPERCPICNWKLRKGQYFAECTNNWRRCQWGVDFIEEEENDEPTVYDYAMGIIIK